MLLEPYYCRLSGARLLRKDIQCNVFPYCSLGLKKTFIILERVHSTGEKPKGSYDFSGKVVGVKVTAMATIFERHF